MRVMDRKRFLMSRCNRDCLWLQIKEITLTYKSWNAHNPLWNQNNRYAYSVKESLQGIQRFKWFRPAFWIEVKKSQVQYFGWKNTFPDLISFQLKKSLFFSLLQNFNLMHSNENEFVDRLIVLNFSKWIIWLGIIKVMD
jgi:hypothetical protein